MLAGEETQRQIVGVIGGAGGQDMGLADPRRLHDHRVGGVALVDGLGRKLAVNAGQDVAPVLDQPNGVILFDEQGGQMGPGAAAAGNDDVHQRPSPASRCRTASMPSSVVLT